jgi:hypothetical protein
MTKNKIKKNEVKENETEKLFFDDNDSDLICDNFYQMQN